MTTTLRARHYATGRALRIEIGEGHIASIQPDAHPNDDTLFVAPGLFDLQVNGCLGITFTSDRLTVAEVRRVVEVFREHGVTEICPTVITSSRETLVHAFRILRLACDSDPELDRAMPCFHLEGPYISPVDGARGAHPLEHVRPPDMAEFHTLQDAAGGRIGLVTLAPEQAGAVEFIAKLSQQSVVLSLGHTMADGDRIRTAVSAGARLSTHLGNGAPAMLPRHPNVIWEQLANDELWANLICDGHHLPPSVVKCLIRAKTPARCILTCDSSGLAGLPPGRYSAWGSELEVLPGGKVVVPGTEYLAGSGSFTDECVALAQRFGEVSLADAVDMASAHPRRLLGLPKSEIAEGERANLVLFRHAPGVEFRVERVLVEGRDAAGTT
jgi:N-acetylglucosamine-6-phosphate deacetylase